MSSRPFGAPATLRVQAVFHELEPHKAEKIASEMIARAHELANLPECECDVDVNVESVVPEGSASEPRAGRKATPTPPLA
jgi:hypothetical protein